MQKISVVQGKGASAAEKYTAIEAFSGQMTADIIKGPREIYRIMQLNGYPASPWWMQKIPETAEEWRELLAVLDKFNKNGFLIKYVIPAGTELKVWTGRAAEQFDEISGQFLGGGGIQLFVDFPDHIKKSILKLPFKLTGWGSSVGLYGYEAKNGLAVIATTEKLGLSETATKKTR